MLVLFWGLSTYIAIWVYKFNIRNSSSWALPNVEAFRSRFGVEDVAAAAAIAAVAAWQLVIYHPNNPLMKGVLTRKFASESSNYSVWLRFVNPKNCAKFVGVKMV